MENRMPFQLKKVSSRGWKVVDDRGREYSRKPLTKTRATAQLRALYAAYNRGEFKEIKGGYIVKHDGSDHTIMYGSGFFSDVFDKVKRVANATVNLVRRIPPIRRDYPPNVRKILAQYGDGEIVGLAVRREPITSFINTALNWLTKGKWDMAKREANYDNLFHLGLVADVSLGGNVKRLLIEKNEVINITTTFKQTGNIQMLLLQPPTNPPITLNQLLNNARMAMGENFFLYDAFKNNCQDFIYNLLSQSGLMTEEASAFIKQPIDSLLRGLPSYTPIAARAITDIAGIANRVIYGEGASCCAECSVGKSCRSANGGMSIVNRGVKLKAVPIPVKGGSFFSDMMYGIAEVMPGLKGVARATLSEKDKQVSKNFFQNFLELREKYGDAEARRRIGGIPAGGSMKGGMDRPALAPCEGVAHTGECSLSAKEIADLRGVLESDDVERKDVVNVIKTLEPTLSSEFDKNLLAEAKTDLIGRSDRRAVGSSINKIITILDRVFPASTGSGLKEMAGGSILSQLKLLKIPKTKYLKSIRDAGKKAGYAPESIDLATDGEHKIAVRTPDGSVRNAGLVGYGDFHIYSLLESKGDVPKGTATEKQKAYLARATKIKGDWKADKYSPNSLAIALLW